MKKLLTMLGALTVGSVVLPTVVACNSGEKPNNEIKNPIPEIDYSEAVQDQIKLIKAAIKQSPEYYTEYSSYLEFKWYLYNLELKDTIVQVPATDLYSFRVAIFYQRFTQLVKEDEIADQLPHEELIVITDNSIISEDQKISLDWEIGNRNNKLTALVKAKDIEFEINGSKD